MHTCSHKLFFRIECCQVLFGYNTPSLVRLARTQEGRSYVLPGSENAPKQRPSRRVEEVVIMGIMKLASWYRQSWWLMFGGVWKGWVLWYKQGLSVH